MKKIKCILLCALGGFAAATLPADAPAPVVIDGLPHNVHVSMALAWRGKSRDGKMSDFHMTRVLQAVRRDEVVDEAEAKLLAALAQEKFSIVLPPSEKVMEVRWIDGSLTKAARLLLVEKEASFDELWPDLTPQNADKLAALVNRSPARRAEARARLLEAIDRALKTPDTGGQKFVAYRALVSGWEERVAAVTSPQTQDALRSWLYEALLLHDRQNPGAVKDFLYSWIKPKDDALRKRTEAGVEALLAGKGTP